VPDDPPDDPPDELAPPPLDDPPDELAPLLLLLPDDDELPPHPTTASAQSTATSFVTPRMTSA